MDLGCKNHVILTLTLTLGLALGLGLGKVLGKPLAFEFCNIWQKVRLDKDF